MNNDDTLLGCSEVCHTVSRHLSVTFTFNVYICTCTVFASYFLCLKSVMSGVFCILFVVS